MGSRAATPASRAQTSGPLGENFVAEIARLEAEYHALEERGVFGYSRGVKLFPAGPTNKSVIGKVVFNNAAAGPLRRSSECGDQAEQLDEDLEYKSLYNSAAGKPSWVAAHHAALRTYPIGAYLSTSAVDFDGEDLDDLAMKRGVRRYPLFDKRSNVCDDVSLAAPDSARSARARQRTPRGAGADAAGAGADGLTEVGNPEDYTMLYLSAAGAPSWATPVERRKASVKEKLKKTTSRLSHNLLLRITQEWKVGSPSLSGRHLGDTPSDRILPGAPPASCGMFRISRKGRSGLKEFAS